MFSTVLRFFERVPICLELPVPDEMPERYACRAVPFVLAQAEPKAVHEFEVLCMPGHVSS